MASVWILPRATRSGGKRYRVLFRVGGRDTANTYAGSFATMREARMRRDWVAGELSAMRVPDLTLLAAPVTARTLRQAAEEWKASRVDVTEATRVLHRVALDRVLPLLGERPVDTLTADDVAGAVTALAASGRKRETIRKSVKYLAAVLEFAGVDPNPARDRPIRLPYEEHVEINPPTAAHVEAVYRTLPPAYRLALLWLDWSGARVASVDLLTLDDYDERDRRVRLRASTTKTRQALWVDLPDTLAEFSRPPCPPETTATAQPGCFPASPRRPAQDGDSAGVQGERRAGVLAARPAAPADLAPPPAGAAVGGDRTVRRPAEAEPHRGHVHARPERRRRARLRGASPMRANLWRLVGHPSYLAHTRAKRRADEGLRGVWRLKENLARSAEERSCMSTSLAR